MKHRKQKHHEWWMMPAKRMIKPWSMVNILVDGEKVTARINGVQVKKLDVSNSLNCTKQMCIDIYGNVYCDDVYYNAKKLSAWSLKSVAFPEIDNAYNILASLVPDRVDSVLNRDGALHVWLHYDVTR